MNKASILAVVVALALGGIGCDSGSSAATASDEPVVSTVVGTRSLGEDRSDLVIPPAPSTTLATTAPMATPRSSILDTPAPRTPELDTPAPVLLYDDSTLVTVRRASLTSGIEGREPIDEMTQADSAHPERVFVFLDVANPTGEAQTLDVVFEHESGRTAGHVSLEVPAGAPRWRTWAFSRNVTAREGAWTAIVTDGDGVTLAELQLDVQ